MTEPEQIAFVLAATVIWLALMSDTIIAAVRAVLQEKG